jgi:solute carrier family 12 sodium/potassium/chloride transporter 2
VLAGGPQMRPPLIDLAYQFTKNNSLMIVGDVIPIKVSYRTKTAIIKEGDSWLENRKVKAFYNVVANMEFEDGVKALLQASGL